MPNFLNVIATHRLGEYRRPCPECDRGPRDVALAIRVDERGATWFCHRCHFTGSHHGAREARNFAARRARSDRTVIEVPLRWSERAQTLWTRSRPVRGTVGEAYLQARRCVLPPEDSDLRFLPAADGWPPCLLARITDFVTNEPMSLHFTKLRVDGTGKAGTDRDKLLLRGHQKKGGVIRLWPDEWVTLSLALGPVNTT